MEAAVERRVGEGTAHNDIVRELTVARRAMACEFSIVLPAGLPRALERAYAALDEVERLEARLSAFREDSEISRWNRGDAGPLEPEVYRLLRWAAVLSAATGGAVDAAAAKLVKAWGFFGGGGRSP